MMKPSSEFEKQIERIHSLIEKTDSVVTWNDKLPDPDDPNSERQIDITIKRENKLTMIECRFRKDPQHVMWIEELIGRRVSLKADGVIAVSSSGFSELAKVKAKSHDIVLRDLKELTDDEVKEWGKCADVKISFFRLKDLNIDFFFDSQEAMDAISIQDVIKATQDRGGLIKQMLETICHDIEKQKPRYPYKIEVDLEIKPLVVKDYSSSDVKISAEVFIEEIQLLTPMVQAYGSVESQVVQREVTVESKNLGRTEVIQSSDTVSVLMDLSAIECVPNRLFRYFDFDFKRIVTGKQARVVLDKKFQDFIFEGGIWMKLKPRK